jgi:hypothetical protein
MTFNGVLTIPRFSGAFLSSSDEGFKILKYRYSFLMLKFKKYRYRVRRFAP